MPRGNVKTWKLSDPALVPNVLTDNDFLSNGFVWGQDGAVHYCFVDPGRYLLDVWEKGFNWSKFGWLAINLAAALAVGWFAGPLAGLIVFFSVPTLPAVLFGHYRATAESQSGPVVSNGPQMEYPVKGGLMAVLGVAGGAGMLPALLPTIGAYLSTKAGITVLGLSLGPTIPTLLAAIGSGANGAALALFLLGKFSTPYDRVTGTGVLDPGDKNYNWHYIARTAPAISTYTIKSGQVPLGLPVSCGGVVGMIENRAVIYGGVGWPLAVWALIPLTPDGRIIDPPPGSEGFVYDPIRDDPANWVKALVLVAGSPTWSPAETGFLVTHGVVAAIGTDGNQSPVLGSSGELVMECHMFLDCIQKYGLMMVPPGSP